MVMSSEKNGLNCSVNGYIPESFVLIKNKSSQVSFIYIALLTLQVVSKQLHSDNVTVLKFQ